MRACGCGRLLDAFGHHRSACAISGVLGQRVFALESAMARICREGGARVMTNVLAHSTGRTGLKGGHCKERVHPELTGVSGRARVVVLAGEVGGRWSSETGRLLVHFGRSQSALRSTGCRARMAWRRRWASVLSCAAARSFVLSLGEVRASPGVDGEMPSVHVVVGDPHCVSFLTCLYPLTRQKQAVLRTFFTWTLQ